VLEEKKERKERKTKKKNTTGTHNTQQHIRKYINIMLYLEHEVIIVHQNPPH